MADPVNLLVLTSLSSLISLLVLGSLARSGMPGISDCLWSNVLLMVSTMLFALRGHAPEAVTLVMANGGMLATIGALYAGCRRFFGRPPRYGILAAAAVPVLAAVAYFNYVQPDLGIRVALMSGFYAVLCMLLAVIVLKHRTAGRLRYGHYFLTGTALFCSAGHALRTAVYGLGVDKLASILQPTQWNLAFITLGVLAMPSLTMGVVLLIHDRMLSESERAASMDFLTRVLSRRAFFARAAALLGEAGTQDQRPALLMLDLDRFKAINDEHGHAAGDAVLRHFADLAQASLRPGDLFCRLGGEEFALLYRPGCHSEAMRSAEGLRAKVLAHPCPWGAGELAYAFSAGLASWRPGESLDRLLARADQGLYAAKQRGRNCIVDVDDDPAPPWTGFTTGGAYRAS